LVASKEGRKVYPRYKLAPTVQSEPSDDGCILLRLDTGAVYGLNQTGARIVAELQEAKDGVSLQAIVPGLLDQFDVRRQRLTADLIDFFSELEKRGLVLQCAEPCSEPRRVLKNKIAQSAH
jgi:hypothetical protein